MSTSNLFEFFLFISIMCVIVFLCNSQSKKWPDKPCHKGFLFIPTEDHVGLSIQLKVRVRDIKGMAGVPFGTNKFFDPYGQPIECKSPVLIAPNQVFHQQR